MERRVAARSHFMARLRTHRSSPRAQPRTHSRTHAGKGKIYAPPLISHSPKILQIPTALFQVTQLKNLSNSEFNCNDKAKIDALTKLFSINKDNKNKELKSLPVLCCIHSYITITLRYYRCLILPKGKY